MIGCQRHLFELPEEIAYLNCAFVGPLLKSAEQAGAEGLELKRHPWKMTSEDFFTHEEQARNLFAQMIGASAEQVAIVTSTSYGLSLAARNLSLGKGETILVLEREFPSNYYVWEELAAKTGGKVVTVPRPKDFNWAKAVLEHIDGTVRVLALPQVHWTDGTFVDLKAIRAAIGKNGPALVLDLTQSAGAYPFDVKEIAPDFIAAASYKWLLGQNGIGFFYAAPSYGQGEPIEYNWANRAGSEDFSQLVNYRKDYQPGMRRFDAGGIRASTILLPMVTAALKQLLEWKVEDIASTLSAMLKPLRDASEGLGCAPLPSDHPTMHMYGLRRESPWPDALKKALLEANIQVSFRGSCIRVSPHLYNTPRDIARFLEAVKRHV